jgi:hypothetical protein
LYCQLKQSFLITRYICPEVYSEENRPKIFFPRSIISRRLRSFKRIFYYEDLLLDPFPRIRRVPCFSGLLFFISTGVSSGLNGSRTAERRTPQDAEGRRRRLRSDRSRITYRAYRNRASILLVSGISVSQGRSSFSAGR